MKSKRALATAAAAVCAAACTSQAMAAPYADLRNIGAQANWSITPDDATLRYNDSFNNNDPQTGGSYLGGYVAPSPLYSVSGSVAGAETLPGDYPNAPQLIGEELGQLRFTKANGTTPTLLTVNGVQYSNSSNYIRMNGPTLDGVPSTLFHMGQRSFAASAAWDFSTPDPGMRYGARFTDANIGDDGFDDLISLDVINNGGIAALQLRRIAGSETTGSRTITEVETRSFASGLTSGYELADINLIAMHLYWFGDIKQVAAEVEMLRISDGGATIEQVGRINFNNRYTIFNGPDRFTRYQVGAQWSEEIKQPIPEPSSWALMTLGLAGLGFAARRRGAKR